MSPHLASAGDRALAVRKEDRIIDELRQYDFEIISTDLPEEQEKQLREAFAAS